MGDEDVLGFPGGPPHPPYGEPLAARTAKPDDSFAGLPESPPRGAPPEKRKPKKRRSRKKKRTTEAEGVATGSSHKVPWWKRTGIGLLIALSLLLRFCGDGDENPTSSELLLGGAGLFERVDLELCEAGLVLTLPPEKEMPSAGPPSDPSAVKGKGIGDAVWAIRMGGIIEPFGLRGRFWGENQQIVTFHDDETALLHRITGAGAERANHFIGLSFSSGRVEWQKLLLGAVLGSTADHLWLAATASERSTVIATVNMTTGGIEDCLAAHSKSAEDPPPLFDSHDQTAFMTGTGSPTTNDAGLYVRPAGFDPTMQYLVPGADPTTLRIPEGQSLWSTRTATADIITITPLESKSPKGSLQGWSTQDLTRVWGTSEVGDRVDAAVSTADTTVVHERAKTRDASVTAAYETLTGNLMWEARHDEALSSSVAGLHLHEDTAVLSAFDLDTNLAVTTFMSPGERKTLDRSFLDFASEERIALITQLENGESFGRVFALEPKRKTIARLEEVGAILTFNDEILVVEITTQGEPWLLGIELAPPSGGGGGGKGGKGGGGGKNDKENQDQNKDNGSGGGGGGGGGKGDDDEDGPPST